MRAKLVETIEVANTLGEGPLWCAETRRLWWTDIQESRIYRLTWPGLQIESFAAPERICSFSLISGEPDILLVAFESGFALFEPARFRTLWLARPQELGAGVRMNDGRTGPDGAFWAGSMTEQEVPSGTMPPGILYRIDEHGMVTSAKQGLTISNGLCWNPSGDTIYLADSPTQTVMRARFNASGPLNFEPFYRIGQGYPDGAVTDSEGIYWSAIWEGSRLDGISPDGHLAYSIPVPAAQVTCPVFGGDELSHLFVTSARDGLSADELANDPEAGHIFVYETSRRGWSGLHGAKIASQLTDRLRRTEPPDAE